MNEASTGLRQHAKGRYNAVTPWSALAAVAATVLTLSLAILAGSLVAGLPAGWFAPSSPLHDTKAALFAQMPPLQLMAALASAQAVVILLVLLAAGLFRGRPAKVLALKTVPSATMLGRAFALMALLLAPYNLAVYLLSPESLLADLKLFAELMRSEAAWLVVIVVSLGAPFSEELLFRGFLQPALAQSRIGYFGASLVTTMGWTALHAGYTPAGLIEVFLIGLFFSWLLWHTGSLWAAILCHAAYNTLLLAIIALVSLPA